MRVKTRAKSVRRVTGCLFCSCTCSVVQITARGQRKHSSISLHTMMSCCIRFVAREDFCLYGWVVFHGASNHIFFTHGLSAVSRKNIWIDYLGLTVVDRAVVNRGVQIALLCCLHFIWEFSQMVGSPDGNVFRFPRNLHMAFCNGWIGLHSPRSVFRYLFPHMLTSNDP